MHHNVMKGVIFSPAFEAMEFLILCSISLEKHSESTAR
jgi:hypothetical protein